MRINQPWLQRTLDSLPHSETGLHLDSEEAVCPANTVHNDETVIQHPGLSKLIVVLPSRGFAGQTSSNHSEGASGWIS